MCVVSGTRPEVLHRADAGCDLKTTFLKAGATFTWGQHGFNSVAGIRDDEPWVVECRRRDDGYKTWASHYGQHYMASDGLRGGHVESSGAPAAEARGRRAQQSSAGRSEPYRRMPDSYHRMVSWITKGVDGEIIGDFGLADGGVAGLRARSL